MILHVDIFGDGPPAIFVHGSFGWGLQSFPKQVSISDHHKLLFIDRRGFGQSPDAIPRVDFDADRQDLIEIIEDLGEPAHLVGHSYGAVPCLLLAQQRTELVKSLVLVEPSAFDLVRGNLAVEEFIQRMQVSILSKADPTPREFLRGFIESMGYANITIPEPDLVMARSIMASATERRPWEANIDLDLLKQAAVPTLIVNGSWATAPSEARRIGGGSFHAVAERLQQELPNLRRVIVESASHNPQMVGTVFNKEVRHFWAEVEARALED